MPLTILPQISSVGFAPQYHSAKPQLHKTKSINTQEAPNGQVFINQTESNTAKIISEDNKASSDNIDVASAEKKIRVRIDPESKEVIIEVVNNKTGEKVLQIPGEEYLKLTQRIADFNDKHIDQTV
jgi:uncharacterized FlaG/YvyC family protein